MSNPAPVKLQFEDSGEWYSLPEWAEYFIRIGKHIAAAPQDRRFYRDPIEHRSA